MSVERKVFAGFGLVVVILMAVVVVARRSIGLFQNQSQWVAHTQDVLGELGGLNLLVKESESSHRGFAVTGNPAFLGSYREAINGIPQRLQRLRTLTADNPGQQRRLDTLSRLVGANVAFRTAAIALQQTAGIEPARRRMSDSSHKAQSDSIGLLITELEGAERTLLAARSDAVNATGRQTMVLLTLGAVLAIVTIIVAAVTIGRAMRERRAAEHAARESELRMTLALDASRMGAWDLDLVHDTSVRSLRHDQIFGYESPLPEWGSKTFLTHIVPEDRAGVEERFAAAAADGKLAFECRIILPDHSVRWIAAEGRVYRNAHGHPVRMLGTVMDITDRKEAAQSILRHTTQVEAANAELEAFSYSVSHDLRAPLRHIDGFADLLRRNTAGQLDSKAQGYLQTISSAAKQMGRLIDDLLAFSRMGRIDMHSTTVELDPLVAAAIHDLQSEIGTRGIDWAVAPLPEVFGDPSMLRQVFANLIGNAVKYTGKTTPARIEIGVDGSSADEVTFFVRDNGAGFDPAYTHKLFGVFQRLHSTHEFEGTGIGLAIVRRIVARHGGRAWASGVVDAGATFFVSLPRSRHEVTYG